MRFFISSSQHFFLSFLVEHCRSSESCGRDLTNYFLSSQYQTTLCGLRHTIKCNIVNFFLRHHTQMTSTLHPCEVQISIYALAYPCFHAYLDSYHRAWSPILTIPSTDALGNSPLTNASTCLTAPKSLSR